VEIIYSDFTILEGYYILPAQEFLSENETPEFVIDNETYSNDTFYPSYDASIGEPVIMRGHRITSLSLYPVQHNPVKKQLRVYSKIEVRINYDQPAQIEGIEERLESEAFESLCESFILNYKSPDKYLTRRYKSVGSPSVDYLIITHDDFFNQVGTLADWKEKKGLRTKIVKTSDISSPAPPTAADITDYLQNAYDTWNPPPTYVLLVGDSEFIPTHYQTPHPWAHDNDDVPTDLYYSTLNGNDHFPGIFLGRISVDTAAETTTIVNKILDYERDPPNNANFYNDISLCAHFQDRDNATTPVDERDGFEDRRFILTSEEVRDYLLTQGYDVERIYNTDAGVNPTNYNNGVYDNGDPLPADLLMPGFAWDGDTADVTAAFNAGRFIMNFRDHGGKTGWGDPDFHNGDIPGLTNNDELSVVFSIACQCGWFDGETDPYAGNTECFSEEILRYGSGGAVATIASTRDSPSGYNDALMRGFFDAMWQDFDPTMTTGAMFELGQIHTYGKLLMAVNTTFATASRELLVYEEYHIFGDPEMWIWTEQPQPLTVTHPSTIGSGGSQKFVVNVTDGVNPVLHALVGLQKDNDVYPLGYTDAGGHVIFDIIPYTGGNLNITVTKHNYLPYEGNIAVTDSGASITMSPDIGPPTISFTINGSKFDGGETVNIDFGGTSIGSASASGGSFSKSFTVPSVPEGPTNVIAVGQSSGRAAVAVFNVLPDQPLPDPYTYSQWDSTTWYLAGGDKVWNNPCIQLYEGNNPVSSGNLVIGTTYRVEATIHNSATVPAAGTQVTFKWADLGIGQEKRVWHLIDPEDTVDVPASPETITANVYWTPIQTGHCCIDVEIYHPWDSNMGNNRGRENTQIHPISSPAEISFNVSNPTNATALVYLEVTQSGGLELWETRVERPYPQVLKPNETNTATLIVNASEWASIGENRTITVTGTIDGKTIGGIEFQVVKDHPPILTDGYVNPNSGVAGTTFTYGVTYIDEDDHPPMESYPKLPIFKGGVPVSGSPFTMIEEDATDILYTDGKNYTYSIPLLEPGNDYTYLFYAKDSLNIDAIGPATKLKDGPIVHQPIPEVPALTSIGLVVLVVLLSVIAISKIRRRES
jgi:hypothetical protein